MNVEFLDKEQLAFLKKLQNVDKLKFSDLTDVEQSIALYFESDNLVNIEHAVRHTFSDNKVTPYTGPAISVSISERGKSYLASVKKGNLKYWIPIVINFIIGISALVLSIIGLQ